jgi:hypothetical protein
MTSAPVLPNYLGLPFRILVSPFVHFDPETRLTDILMFNSKNLGALIVAEEAHVKAGTHGLRPAEHEHRGELRGGDCAGRADRCRREERDGPAERVHQAGSLGFQPGLFVLPDNKALARHARPTKTKNRSLSRCR